MNIKQKVYSFWIWYCFAAVFLFIISIIQLRSFSQKFKSGLPEEFGVYKKSLYMKYLSDETIYLDEVLTQSARNYSFTGNTSWKDRYFENELTLDSIIQQGKVRGNTKDYVNFKSLDSINTALVKLEHEAIGLTDNGNTQEAIAILESGDYGQLKSDYLKSLMDYQHSSNSQLNEDFEMLQLMVDNHMEENEASLRWLVSGIGYYVLLTLLFSIIFSVLFSRLILLKINLLQLSAEQVKGGNLDYRIPVIKKDEFGLLAETFNAMIDNIRIMTEKIRQHKMEEELLAQRDKISRDLHDRTGIVLSSIKLQLNHLRPEKNASDQRLEAFGLCQSLLDEAYAQIREISESAISNQEFLEAIDNLARRTQLMFKNEVRVITNMVNADFDHLDPSSIYLFIRELLNNAVKHGLAQQIVIQLLKHDDCILIMIEDDGQGFNPAEVQDSKENNGIRNARSRVIAMNGQFHIDSTLFKGTTITIQLPVSDDAT